jgi:hypothetical protein
VFDGRDLKMIDPLDSVRPPHEPGKSRLPSWLRRLLQLGAVVLVSAIAAYAIALRAAQQAQQDGALVARQITFAVGKSWRSDRLIERADPNLLQEFGPETLKQLLGFFGRKLGALEGCGGAEASPATFYLGTKGFRTVAKYRLPCSFARGRGSVHLTLVRESREWRVAGFQIESDVLAQ